MIDPHTVGWKATGYDLENVTIEMYQFIATINIKRGVTKQHFYDFVKAMAKWCAETYTVGSTVDEIRVGQYWNVNIYHTMIAEVEVTDIDLIDKPATVESYDLLLTMGLEFATQFKLVWGIKG